MKTRGPGQSDKPSAGDASRLSSGEGPGSTPGGSNLSVSVRRIPAGVSGILSQTCIVCGRKVPMQEVQEDIRKYTDNAHLEMAPADVIEGGFICRSCHRDISENRKARTGET